MLWKVLTVASSMLNIVAALLIVGAIGYENQLQETLAERDREIAALKRRPEAITTLTDEQFKKFLALVRTESGAA